MNQLRCWLRDTVDPEKWGDENYSDKVILQEERLPNDMRELYGIIASFEKASAKQMKKAVQDDELWGFLKDIKGIDAKIAGKLIYYLGDLRNYPTVSHLWSYSGLDGPGWRKRPHNWDVTSLCYVIADSFIKQRTPHYRDIYDKRKEYEATKPPCEKCLEQGFEEHCRPGHLNNKARRYMVKQFLKDAWVYVNKADHQSLE